MKKKSSKVSIAKQTKEVKENIMPFGLDDAIMLVSASIKIYNWLIKDVIETENSPEIEGSAAKRLQVEQLATKRIDELDIHPHLRGEIKRNMTSAINETVKTFNDNGIFAHGVK